MSDFEEQTPSFRWQATADDKASAFYRRLEAVALISGTVATSVRHGLIRSSQQESTGLGVVVVLSAIIVAAAYVMRYRLSLRRATFRRETFAELGFVLLWSVGLLVILAFGPLLWKLDTTLPPRGAWLILQSEYLLGALFVFQAVTLTRGMAARGLNPALLLVFTFVLLIGVGTGLLMLPRAHAGFVNRTTDEGAPFLTALFTSTSASCVTGLVVEDTGAYWSRFGQTVIMILIQLGGLGIMTSGAVFVALVGRQLQVQETATMRKLLDSERMADVRRLLVTILLFTLAAELIGAVLLSGLWADEPLAERTFRSIFHSVSAFCNAGFSVETDSGFHFLGSAGRWQVGVVICGLIITGGLGFGIIYNVFRVLRYRWKKSSSNDREEFLLADRRLNLTSQIVLLATLVLLVGGTGMYYLLESFGAVGGESHETTWADAWFTSVTLRTAGFNTIDMGGMQTTTKLFGVAMMFIGASPGSTGGGVKTVCIALVVLSVVSLLNGKDRVELGHRRIPDQQISRAFLIVTLSVVIVLVATFLLVLFENQPARFVDHLFEATSAFGTVGLSTLPTTSLSSPSRVVIIVVMFIGRVGPLTLVLALAGKSDQASYDLPRERVALG